MTPIVLLERARSARGKKIRYRLGAGGLDPDSSTPANIANECDCSGFVCWCLHMSRRTDHPLYVRFNGGWINTDAMVFDITHPAGFFGPLDKPRVGCIVVYGKGKGHSYGHVGIISEVKKGVATKVIHCSAGNFRRYGDAVYETPPSMFKVAGTVYGWYAGFDEPG